MKFLAKWAERYGLTIEQARRLRRLGNLYNKQWVNYLNGDPHPLVPDHTDKSANSAGWLRDSQATADRFTSLAKKLGFDGVDFGVGTWPFLEKDGDTSIAIP